MEDKSGMCTVTFNKDDLTVLEEIAKMRRKLKDPRIANTPDIIAYGRGNYLATNGACLISVGWIGSPIDGKGSIRDTETAQGFNLVGKKRLTGAGKNCMEAYLNPDTSEQGQNAVSQLMGYIPRLIQEQGKSTILDGGKVFTFPVEPEKIDITITNLIAYIHQEFNIAISYKYLIPILKTGSKFTIQRGSSENTIYIERVSSAGVVHPLTAVVASCLNEKYLER